MVAFAVLLCSSLLFGADTLGQEEADEDSRYSVITRTRYKNYIGIAGGFITGNGVAYRRWLNQKVGFQINVFPYYTEEEYPEDDNDFDYYYEVRDSGYLNSGFVNYGLSLLINLAEMRYLRVVGYTGCNHLIDIEEGDYYSTTEEWDSDREDYYNQTVHKVSDRVLNTLAGGLGGGVEFYVFRFGFSVNFGIFGAYTFENHTKKFHPSVDGGVFFRF